MHLVGFHYKITSRCTVLWMSNSIWYEAFCFHFVYNFFCSLPPPFLCKTGLHSLVISLFLFIICASVCLFLLGCKSYGVWSGHSHQPSTEFESMWSCTSTPPYAFRACNFTLQIFIMNVKFWIITVSTMKITVFWNVTLCSLVNS